MKSAGPSRGGGSVRFGDGRAVDCEKMDVWRAAGNSRSERDRVAAAFPTGVQPSCDSSTCIANSVLSRQAWNVLLPRFVNRSSPKSNFINL